MTLRIGIITAPRPRPTVEKSIASLRRAGFNRDVVVFSDGGDPMVQDGIFWLPNEVPLGNKRNWIRALGHLSSGMLNSEWVMICEDDIVWQAGASTALQSDLLYLERSKNDLHMVGALSLFACRRMTKPAEDARGRMKLGAGWHWKDMQFGKKTWGAQCLVFNREMADWLKNDATFQEYAAREDMDKNIDLIIGECLNRQGRKILYRIPCLVDHVLGAGNSSLYGDKDRPNLMTDYFRGPVA
jgi:hypothetical protein